MATKGSTTTPEYSTFKKCYGEIVHYMKQELGSICDKCFANGYIPQSVRNFSRNSSRPEEERAQKVADSLLSQIEYDTSVYYGFCKIVKQYNPWTQKLTKILEDTLYGELKPLAIVDETNDKQLHTPLAVADEKPINITDSFACPYCGECTLNQYFSVEGCPKKQNRQFPFLITSHLSTHERIDLEARLNSETRKIIVAYSNFTVGIRDSLDGRVDICKVKDSVLSLEAFRNNIGVKLLDIQDYQKIQAATSVSEVFTILRSYISFFNYQIVEILINQYGTDKDRDNLSKYVCKLTDFCKRSVFEIPSKFFHSESRPAAKVLVLKCTEDITTLGDTKRIRDSFADVLGLQPSALQLESIKEGCVELHFIISPAIADQIVPLFSSKESYFKEIGISAISINSQTQTVLNSMTTQNNVEGNASYSLENSHVFKDQPLYGFTPLEPILGSTNTTFAKSMSNKVPFNRHASSEGPVEPELDSTSYQQTVPEYTIIPQLSKNSAKKTSLQTSRRLPVGQRRTPSEDVYDEMHVVDELDELLGKIVEKIKYGNVDEYKAQFSVVMNLHKRLTDTYQREKEHLKEYIQSLEQEARKEEELWLKANRDIVENDLAKQVKDKEAEIKGLKAKREIELNELRVEKKRIVMENIFDQLRECESLLRTQKPIADILVIIRQKLSMLKPRPYSA